MSRGFLMHAYDNEQINYGTMAVCSALLIKKNLHHNQIALVTDQKTIDALHRNHGSLLDVAFDHVILVEHHGTTDRRVFFDPSCHEQIPLAYQNGNRSDSYQLSPFDETLLIDADYLILDGELDSVWGTKEDLLVNRWILDLAYQSSPPGFEDRLNPTGIPMYWATLMYFQKNKRAQILFDTMRFIKDNFSYYHAVFGFAHSGYFRNDHALSIALHLLNGHIEQGSVSSFPTSHILVANERDDMMEISNDGAYFLHQSRRNGPTLHKIMTNVHVMNKLNLMEMAPRIIEHAQSR
jgi:hypothetical protein